MCNQRLKSTPAGTTHVLICAAAECIISTLTSELICIQAEAPLLYYFFFCLSFTLFIALLAFVAGVCEWFCKYVHLCVFLLSLTIFIL